MLMGKDVPDSGDIKIGDTVNMIGVGQDRMEELNPANTVFEEITGNMDELELGTQMVNSRSYCSWFGFKSGQQQLKVGNLSGGERNRVQLYVVVVVVVVVVTSFVRRKLTLPSFQGKAIEGWCKHDYS